jgi:predicted acyl esterase
MRKFNLNGDSTPKRRQFLRLAATAGTVGAAALGGKAAAQVQDDGRSYDIEPMSITVHDGTVLYGHVYLPKDAERPLAPVLSFSPYWNTAARGPSSDPGPLAEFIHEFLQDDFAVAAINMRGTGISEGCLQFGGPLDFKDAHDVVEAVAAADWSNGNVGMWGHSYDGFSQYLAIAGDPPSLEAVVPSSSVLDLWHLLTRNGAPLIGYGPSTRTAWDALTSLGSLPPQPDHVDCPNRTGDWLTNLNLAVNANRTPYFQVRSYHEQLAESRVPMFVSNGLLQLSEGHIMQIDGLYGLRPPQSTRMVLGQWGHSTPTTDDYFDQVRAWFDHYLRDGPQRVKPGIVDYQDDTGAWHTADQWPPDGNQQSLYLSDGTLVADGSAVTGSIQVFQSDDTDPGLSAERCGPRQALYVSPPLAEDVGMAGNFTIETTLTSTLPGGNFAAFLFHTPGPGTCPDPNAHGPDTDDQVGRKPLEFARTLADLRHWKTLGRAHPFPVGDPTTVSFDSHPFATEVPAGNRIVLAIAGGSSEIEPNEFKPTIAVTTGPDTPGSVELPVVEGDLTFAE